MPALPSRSKPGYVAALIALLVAASLAIAQQPVRVATYNIRFFNASVGDERLANLRQVVAALDADIIGLQEIDDRAALETLFDPAQ
ncbi:MAG: endonuclease/exonuclease/phosphatase family protein [Phycisphaerales bacterium]